MSSPAFGAERQRREVQRVRRGVSGRRSDSSVPAGRTAGPLRAVPARLHRGPVGRGPGTADAEYFRRLPEPTPGGPIEWQWKLRRRTWATVRDRVLPVLGDGLVVVDVGAGVGWLSNRMYGLGHIRTPST